MELWDSWIAIGLIAAAAWGLSCVIDVCFVGRGIFREPVDGVLVAGIFCILPFAAFGGLGALDDLSLEVAAVAALAGLCYLLHVWFYFKALFALNDASNAEIFNTLSVLLVPVLAFALLGEVLEARHYVAIGLSVSGVAVLLAFQLGTLTWRVAAFLGASVSFISLTMVMQAWVLKVAGFETAVSLFSGAAFAAVLLMLGARSTLRRRTTGLCRRFGLLFAAVQLLELVAVLGSQRATDVGPSVSLVALLESSLPIFVMAFSRMLFGMSRFWPSVDGKGIRSALAAQTRAYPAKLVSLLLIASAILLVDASAGADTGREASQLHDASLSQGEPGSTGD